MKTENEPNSIKAIYLLKQALATVETLNSASTAVDNFRKFSLEIKALNLKSYENFYHTIDSMYVIKDKRKLRQAIISSLKACHWLGGVNGSRNAALLKYLQANSNDVTALDNDEFLKLKALYLIQGHKNNNDQLNDAEIDVKVKQLENNRKLHFVYTHNRK